MKKRALRVATMSLVLAYALLVGVGISGAQNGAIAEKTKDAQKLAGYFNLYWEAKAGKLWLEIDKGDTEILYLSGLPAGVGSNDIGLDRGQLGATRLVRFERSGPKILLGASNLGFR